MPFISLKVKNQGTALLKCVQSVLEECNRDSGCSLHLLVLKGFPHRLGLTAACRSDLYLRVPKEPVSSLSSER